MTKGRGPGGMSPPGPHPFRLLFDGRPAGIARDRSAPGAAFPLASLSVNVEVTRDQTAARAGAGRRAGSNAVAARVPSAVSRPKTG